MFEKIEKILKNNTIKVEDECHGVGFGDFECYAVEPNVMGVYNDLGRTHKDIVSICLKNVLKGLNVTIECHEVLGDVQGIISWEE